MVSLFSRKSAGWIGIDIGSSAVKLVALSRHGSGLQLDGYAVVSLPATAVVDGNIEVISEVSGAIERGLKLCGGKYTHAVVSVPSSAVITKRLNISNLFVGIELEDQVRVEADQFIPYPLEEVALDFEVKGPVVTDPNLLDILLVACRRDTSEAREEVVSDAGLKCGVIDVDTYAMERVLKQLVPELSEGHMVAIVDVGAATLCLNVLRDGEVVYNREQAFGGNDLSHAVGQQFGMSLDEVEHSLREQTLAEEIHERIVVPFTSTVVQQISRALQFFYSSGVQGELKGLYLCGGVAGIEGLVEKVEEETGLLTQQVRLLSKAHISPRINRERLERDELMLVKACGLALRSFEE